MKFHITAKYSITSEVVVQSAVRDGVQVRVATLLSGGIVLDVSFEASHAQALRDELCNALVEFIKEGKSLGIFGNEISRERAMLLEKATLSLNVNGHNIPLKNPLGMPFVVSGDLPSYAMHIIVAAENVIARIKSCAGCGAAE